MPAAPSSSSSPSSPSMLASLDASLGPLIVQYARGTEGASVVLKDALLERESPSASTLTVSSDIADDGASMDVTARLHNVATLLSRYGQFALGCACAKAAIKRASSQLTSQQRSTISAALSELERGIGDPAFSGPEARSRQAVFQVWREVNRSAVNRATSRAVWSVWMLMRDMPLVALQALRSIDEKEIETQIDLISELLTR